MSSVSSLADSATEVQPEQKEAHQHRRKHKKFAHAQGVLDWVTDRLADLIREKFKSATKKPYSFPKIRIADGDELQTLQTALNRGVMSSARSGIQSVLDKGYSVGIGISAGGGVGVGVGAGAGVVLSSDGHIGVYGEAQVKDGMFEELSANVKITIVKGGLNAFNDPTVSAGIELGAGFVGSIEALGDDTGNLRGVATCREGEEIGAFFTQGVGWAVQLLAQSTIPVRIANAYALDADMQPVQLPPATIITGWKKQVIRAAVDALVAAGMPPVSTVLPTLVSMANHQGYSVGIGLGGDAGLLGGAGLGFGVILAPNDDVGVFGSVEIDAGLLAGISGGARVIVIRGGIDVFNETGYALGVTVEEGPSVNAIALFDAQRNFHGVSFQLGVGAALSPIQIFTGVEKSVSTAVTQSLGVIRAGAMSQRSHAAALATASTTSGFGVAEDARRHIKCIQQETEQGRNVSFVVRYLLKEMTLAETTALSNAGLQVVSCYENNSGDPSINVYTRAKGHKDGKRAFALAQSFGQPAGTPIYFAIDTDPGGSKQIILDYFQGVQEGCAQYLADMQAKGKSGVLYDIGVYGGRCALEWCHDQGIAKWFWQAFAPAWCNNGNRQVWENANIHTFSRDNTAPLPCRQTFDRLEGWGNEGGWTVAAAAQGQSLSVTLPAAPPSRRYAQGRALDASAPRMIGNSPVNTVTGGNGNVTWELDQFPGFTTTASAVLAAVQSAETIQLANWPYCDHANGTRSCAWFSVDWKFSGQGLGQVRISPTGSQEGAQPLRVEARIEEGKNRDASTSSLVVRFTYHFSTSDGPEVVATTELTLYSDGSLDQKSNWMAARAAA